MKKFIFCFIFALSSFVFAENISIDFTESNSLSESLKMQSVTTIQKQFVLGENTQSFTISVTVDPFKMNKYETTYDLWYFVRSKAEKIGYHFQNPGQEGSLGRRGKLPTDKGKMQPVVNISYRDAVIWCNALSEIEGLTPCYTYKNEVLRDSAKTAQIDLCECNYKANGYRLPSEYEWEFAARLTETGMAAGDLPSENEKDEFNLDSTGTKSVGTSGNQNFSRLFDMTGNVLEFCNEWYNEYCDYGEIGTKRVCRGGSWSKYTPFYFYGDRYAYEPGEAYNYMGFRLCQTITE